MKHSFWMFVVSFALVWSAPAAAVEWMHWPVDRAESSQRYVTQGFYGDYISYCCSNGNNCRTAGGVSCGTHNGYDYGIPTGTPLYAVAPGVVDSVHATDTSGDYGYAGLYVRVRHSSDSVSALGDETYYSAFLHMSRIDVSVGDVVGTTTVVGLSGASGGVAAHLHLHVHTDAPSRYCGGAVDPGCPTAPHVDGSVIPGFAGAPNCQSHCEPDLNMWLQPAAYGGEPYGGCQGLDYLGVCEDSVVKWCDNGSPREVDCAADGRVCVWESDDLGSNCVECESLGLPACDGTSHSRCEAGVVVTEECGFGCDPETGCIDESLADAGNVGTDAGGDHMEDTARPQDDVGVSGAPSDLGAQADAARVIDGRGGCATAPPAPPVSGLAWLLILALSAIGRRRV